MNQEELINAFDKLNRDKECNEKEYEEAIEKYNKLYREHSLRKSELDSYCTHKYADGTSAYEIGYSHGWCKICLAGD